MHLSTPAAVYMQVYLGTPLVLSHDAVCGITMGKFSMTNTCWSIAGRTKCCLWIRKEAWPAIRLHLGILAIDEE